MNYFNSYNIPKHKISPILGKEIKKGIIGSTTYFIKSFDSIEKIDLMEDSKGIFQVFKKGLLLRVFKNNSSISLPLPFKDITKLDLNKGKEIIAPIIFSPLWILLKLGFKIEFARYFRARVHEYSIDPTTLKIETISCIIELETNGYTFNSQFEFFKKFTEIKNLKINKASTQQ